MNGSRILLVEDDEDIGAELTQALAGSGHLPSLARTGAEALTAATLTPPDLVLLDLGLPDIDGVELCRRLRAAAPDGVIVVLTARTGEFDVVIALDAGADDYLTKPFRLTESLSELRDIMNAVKARDADAVAKACLYHIERAGQAGIDALPPDPTDD